MTDVKVVVCGLGNMGLQIARRIAGVYSPLCFDINAEARASAAQHGLNASDSLSNLGDADIVVLSLPHSRASLSTVRELAGVLKQGAVVLETSTVAPADIHEMAAVLEGNGVRLIDAAIVSGVVAMATGKSTLLVGAQELAPQDPVMKVLDAMSVKITWTKELGSAMAMKVIHNAVAHATMVTLAEARGMGLAYGITEEMLVEVLRGEEAGLLRPLLHRLGERVSSKDYNGGMSLAAARKDSLLALRLAAEHHVPLYSIAASHTVYERASNRYSGRDDYAVVAELWSEEQARPAPC